ncbi:hypothetical protein K458DRAFT_358434 [Lentithecium fluviatile CBS 122367]|uniref:C2H2-type domain-containing protein n=1 Tax=Lentithecium fluviatile CBS 122367 TaxID=1168545 RepID=A0A6G1JH68_9PLEO|nr:hypothetical protein K458DRAFT_358434 [Lentithecium fluviatile CBS 122367]
MVHGSGREREVHDRHFQHQHAQQHHASYYPQQHHPQQRGYQVAVSVAPAQYSPQTVEYPYQRHPQSPPSPPVEEQKPSLPSISSLLVIADGEKTSSETGNRTEPASVVHQDGRSSQASQYGPVVVNNQRMTLPPTPPMHPDHANDGNQSPSAASSHSASGPYYLGGALNNVEPHQQRQNIPNVAAVKRDQLPPQASMSPYNAPTYAQSPYASSPGAASATSFYSPESHAYSPMGMYAQRPLPSNFQPQMPLPVPAPNPNGQNPWQHHHYISASSQSAFPQSQDRYICSTCNKAFSRPSSLRIHSHSHTGEKPYKCPQPGCGKAFSVRSNMKRHERGCHASTSASISS